MGSSSVTYSAPTRYAAPYVGFQATGAYYMTEGLANLPQAAKSAGPELGALGVGVSAAISVVAHGVKVTEGEETLATGAALAARDTAIGTASMAAGFAIGLGVQALVPIPGAGFVAGAAATYFIDKGLHRWFD